MKKFVDDRTSIILKKDYDRDLLYFNRLSSYFFFDIIIFNASMVNLVLLTSIVILQDGEKLILQS